MLWEEFPILATSSKLSEMAAPQESDDEVLRLLGPRKGLDAEIAGAKEP